MIDWRDAYTIRSSNEPWPLPIHMMRCYYKDLESGEVSPRYAGQQFYLVDRRETWTFHGSPAPERIRLNWGAVLVWLLVAALAVADLCLLAVVIGRREWL